VGLKYLDNYYFLHLPTERIVKAIIIICDFDVMISFGLFGCADRVSNPSRSKDRCYIFLKIASSLELLRHSRSTESTQESNQSL
jgi:hypothetical protein